MRGSTGIEWRGSRRSRKVMRGDTMCYSEGRGEVSVANRESERGKVIIRNKGSVNSGGKVGKGYQIGKISAGKVGKMAYQG